MNAYFELFGSTEVISESNVRAIALIESLESAEVEDVTKERQLKFGRNNSHVKEKRFFRITPDIYSAQVREWIDNVEWALIECNCVRCYLKSNRTLEEEENFLNTLKGIEYYDGYGCQELYGVIAFKDHSWMSRHEYDGSECWVMNKFPQEPDWNEFENEV